MSEVIKLSSEELRLMQLNELELLVEVDRICRKNGIKYSLDGGTLLGAVRHKGFVPWDDDADIVFSRVEYEKFYEACKTDLNTDVFFFQDYRTDSGYRWGYGKLRHLKTEFVREGQEHMKYKTGICIDLFVDDNIPDGWLHRRWNYYIHFFVRKALYSELGKVAAPNAFLRAWYKVLYLIPRDVLFHLNESLVKKSNQKETEMMCHTLFPTPGPNSKYGIKSDFLKEFEEMEFEGLKFMVTKKWDEYLKYLYVDYMKMPPIEKRVGPAFPSKLELSPITLQEIQARYAEENRLFGRVDVDQ